MHTFHTLFLAAAAGALFATTSAIAAQNTYSATLLGADEVPPNDSAAHGTVNATFDTDTNTFSYTVEYEGLSGPATAAHFHGPADPGANAPPVVPVNGDLASPITGEATLTDEQLTDLKSGKWYFNVHTEKFPDGEIRGQLTESNPD